ncbi:hypothetical protein CYMTET_51932 [Cymbomonas tetramitiformis]|uniref:Ribosome associated membrane protein RAMP4 n=1 Tax=Cymbomonas tetramitiformis TaxID=36881 RepID=A0AAE0ES53_9CHLO|nr:hypothetical protein CYMTET_51932 [Cymbomonas tetramitiformis]
MGRKDLGNMNPAAEKRRSMGKQEKFNLVKRKEGRSRKTVESASAPSLVYVLLMIVSFFLFGFIVYLVTVGSTQVFESE